MLCKLETAESQDWFGTLRSTTQLDNSDINLLSPDFNALTQSLVIRAINYKAPTLRIASVAVGELA
jgi:hypothetical protein